MIVEDLTLSHRQITAYWRALTQRAKAAWPDGRPSPDPWPERSWISSHIAYGGDASSDAASLLVGLAAGGDAIPIVEYSRLRHLGIKHAAALEPAAVASAMSARLDAAIELLRRLWPDGYHELRACGTSICIFSGTATHGFSDPRLFGCIFIHRDMFERASPVLLVERLVHEAGHHALFVETSIDRLIPDDYARTLYSPLRKEPRPALGVLHSAIALARMTAWLSVVRSSAVDFGNADLARFNRHIQTYKQTLDQLAGLRFSEHGQRLHEAFQRHLEKVGFHG